MSFRNLIPILFLSLWSAPALAQTEEPSIIVLGLEMFDGDDEVARELTMAVRMAVLERGGFHVSDRSVTSGNMALAIECHELDDACLGSISVRLHEQYMIYGMIRRVSSEINAGFVVMLSLYDHGAGRTITHSEDHLSYPMQGGEAIVSGRRLIEQLFNGVTPYVESPPVVEPVVEASVTPPVTPTVPAVDHSESDWAAVAWTLIGVAGASLIADIGIWLRLNDLNNDAGFREYRTGASPSTGNVCLGATGRNADICSEGNTLEIAQYVMLGVAIASAGVGAALLVLQSGGSSTERSSVSLHPSASPTGASLTITGTF